MLLLVTPCGPARLRAAVQTETLGLLVIGSADVRPSLQPEQQEEKPKTLIQDSWIYHSCSVHVLCPCLRQRRGPPGPEAVPVLTGRRPHRCRRIRSGSSTDYDGSSFLILSRISGSCVEAGALGIWLCECISGLC